MAKNQTQKSNTKNNDKGYWQASIALSALNVLIMLYQLTLHRKTNAN
ncbi:hypothetical protein [Capnocytophaga sputigena]|nr:hypothetical protein [Capnocytophaga sputigena]VEI52725.1 Uncharacterised protein [Capnocytophaga sputigena]